MCGCTFFPHHSFFLPLSFSWKNLNKATKNTQMIDTQSEWYHSNMKVYHHSKSIEIMSLSKNQHESYQDSCTAEEWQCSCPTSSFKWHSADLLTNALTTATFKKSVHLIGLRCHKDFDVCTHEGKSLRAALFFPNHVFSIGFPDKVLTRQHLRLFERTSVYWTPKRSVMNIMWCPYWKSLIYLIVKSTCSPSYTLSPSY